MPRPLRRVLGAIGRLYKPDSPQQAPQEIDLGAVQIVHDVSREVEVAAARWVLFRRNTHTHGAGSTTYVSKSLRDAFSDLVEDPQAWDFWLAHITASWAAGGAPDPSTVNAGLYRTALGYQLVYMFIKATQAGAQVTAADSIGPNVQYLEIDRQLIRPTDTGSLVSKSTTSAAGAVYVDFYGWLVPRDAAPPPK